MFYSMILNAGRRFYRLILDLDSLYGCLTFRYLRGFMVRADYFRVPSLILIRIFGHIFHHFLFFNHRNLRFVVTFVFRSSLLTSAAFY